MTDSRVTRREVLRLLIVILILALFPHTRSVERNYGILDGEYGRVTYVASLWTLSTERWSGIECETNLLPPNALQTIWTVFALSIGLALFWMVMRMPGYSSGRRFKTGVLIMTCAWPVFLLGFNWVSDWYVFSVSPFPILQLVGSLFLLRTQSWAGGQSSLPSSPATV